MSNPISLPRNLAIYGLLVPVALLLGAMLSLPPNIMTLALVGLLGFVVSFPFLHNRHHMLLIAAWGMHVLVPGMPGTPALWMLIAILSLGFTLLARIMDKERRLIEVPSIAIPLILFIAVVLVTAKITGGIGLRAFGSGTYGGKRYVELILAALAFFSLSTVQIPGNKARLAATLFFLGSATAIVGTALYYVPKLWFLYNFFPTDLVGHQVAADFEVQRQGEVRLTGVSFFAAALFSVMLVRYGVRGLFDFSRGVHFIPITFRDGFGVTQPWRLPLMAALLVLSLFGGFRSMVVMMLGLFALVFVLEGWWRTKWMALLVGAGAVAYVCLLPVAGRLPFSVQRAISFLPGVQVQQAALLDAQASTDWRRRMWQVIQPELPNYLWRGKGYNLNPAELYLIAWTVRYRSIGEFSDFENSLAAGDYHNGPLSVYVPFGLPGCLAFVAFLLMGLRAMRNNLLYGDPKLATINRFLLAAYLARIGIFFFVFGAISSDLVHFVGLVGMSVALNGGIRSREDLPKPVAKTPVAAPSRPRLLTV